MDPKTCVLYGSRSVSVVLRQKRTLDPCLILTPLSWSLAAQHSKKCSCYLIVGRGTQKIF